MALSNINVCNLALTEVGAPFISGMPPADTSEQAYLCDLFWQQTIDEVLMEHYWSCAKHRKELAGSERTLDDEWDYEYALPTNPYCLTVIKIIDYPSAKWAVESRKLLANLETDVVIEYIKRLSPTEMDLPHPALINAFAMRLAAHLSTRLKQARTGKRDLLTEYKTVALPDAISADNRGSFAPKQVNDSWVKAGR